MCIHKETLKYKSKKICTESICGKLLYERNQRRSKEMEEYFQVHRLEDSILSGYMESQKTPNSQNTAKE